VSGNSGARWEKLAVCLGNFCFITSLVAIQRIEEASAEYLEADGRSRTHQELQSQ
jgi:hypothetical protein